MRVGEADRAGEKAKPAPKQDFRQVLQKVLTMPSAPRPAAKGPTARPGLKELGEIHREARIESSRSKQARDEVAKGAEQRSERRGQLHERANETRERVRDLDERTPKAEVTPIAPPVSELGHAPRSESPPVRDASAAVAALVEKIEAFLRSAVPALRVSFTDGVRSLADVEVKRTAKGEVALHLKPTAGASRAEVARHASQIRERLNDQGLRVSALVIG